MNWKAVGLESGKTYATGTHADCSRAVNEGKHKEAIRVMSESQRIVSDEEEIGRLAKEWKWSEEEKSKKTRVRNFEQHKWTTEEEAYIKTNINASNKELLAGIEKHFGKTVTLKALNARKFKLRQLHGIPAIPSNRWKPEEDEYIIKNCHRLTYAKISEEIDRTTSAVGERVKILRRLGKIDSSERREPEQSNRSVQQPVISVAVPESGKHPDNRMGADEMKRTVTTVERAEKMDTTQIIKPEKGDKTAIHMTICKQLNQTYQEKNADYGDSFGETYRKLGIISAVTRISDKTNRLISLAGKPEAERLVKDESIADTLLDLANYAIMTLAELEAQA